MNSLTSPSSFLRAHARARPHAPRRTLHPRRPDRLCFLGGSEEAGPVAPAEMRKTMAKSPMVPFAPPANTPVPPRNQLKPRRKGGVGSRTPSSAEPGALSTFPEPRDRRCLGFPSVFPGAPPDVPAPLKINGWP